MAFDGVEELDEDEDDDEDDEDEPTTSTDDSSSFVRVVLEDDPVSGYEAWEKVFTHAACVGLSMDALLDHLVKNAMHRTGARRATTPTTDAAPSATDPASSPRMRVYVLFGGSPSSGYTGRQLYLTLRNIPTIDATPVLVSRAPPPHASTGRRPRVAITLRLGRGPESMVRERRFTSSRSRFGSILHAQTRARGFRKVSLDIAVERRRRARVRSATARVSPGRAPLPRRVRGRHRLQRHTRCRSLVHRRFFTTTLRLLGRRVRRVRRARVSRVRRRRRREQSARALARRGHRVPEQTIRSLGHPRVTDDGGERMGRAGANRTREEIMVGHRRLARRRERDAARRARETGDETRGTNDATAGRSIDG